MSTSELQDCIHHQFAQVKLLTKALTHSSYANEQEGNDNNERLEFLGDAVLELCISEESFKRFPEAPEGQMTRIRSQLVKEQSLAELARELRLDRCILLGRGEELQGGRDRDSLLADTFEAVMGAVFLDAGYEIAKKTILHLFQNKWPESPQLPKNKDYKSRLQEVSQDKFKDRPVYTLIEATGPEHNKVFDVDVKLPNDTIFRGQGTSVKRAEQESARNALAGLQKI